MWTAFSLSRWRAMCSISMRTSGKRSSICVEVGREDADDFDVVERGAGGGAGDVAEQTHFAEVAAAREIGEDELFVVAQSARRGRSRCG